MGPNDFKIAAAAISHVIYGDLALNHGRVDDLQPVCDRVVNMQEEGSWPVTIHHSPSLSPYDSKKE